MTWMGVLALFCVATLSASETTFTNIRMMVPEGKKLRERQVELMFAADGSLNVRRGRDTLVNVPYSRIEKIDYEFARRHRTAEGAAVMVFSLGAGAVLMFTKTTSHWLGIEFRDGNLKKQLLLRLNKSDYNAVIAAAEAATGQKVARLADPRGPEKITKGSKNVDEVVSYSTAAVEAALRRSMEAQTCRISKQESGYLECSRPVGAEIYKGEKVVARYSQEGAGTRVRIETHKGAMGRAVKKNWSTPIFRGMMDALAKA